MYSEPKGAVEFNSRNPINQRSTNFHKPGSHHKILGAGTVTQNVFRSENPKYKAPQNLLAWVNFDLRFAHPCSKCRQIFPSLPCLHYFMHSLYICTITFIGTRRHLNISIYSWVIINNYIATDDRLYTLMALRMERYKLPAVYVYHVTHW